MFEGRDICYLNISVVFHPYFMRLHKVVECDRIFALEPNGNVSVKILGLQQKIVHNVSSRAGELSWSDDCGDVCLDVISVVFGVNRCGADEQWKSRRVEAFFRSVNSVLEVFLSFACPKALIIFPCVCEFFQNVFTNGVLVYELRVFAKKVSQRYPINSVVEASLVEGHVGGTGAEL